MEYGFRPVDGHEARLQKSFDTLRQTREMIAMSKREMAGTQRTIQFSQEAIKASWKLLGEHQS
jgi:hypothetical protein